MIEERLKTILRQNQAQTNKNFVRNLLKEALQLYVLNFIYATADYKDLIFTGGTALRLCFGLPRLSEDVDFDIEKKEFDFNLFLQKISDYFTKKLQYKNFSLTFREKNKILFLKFPLLQALGFARSLESNILFVRCDFSFNQSAHFGTENRLISSTDFSFLVRTYDLPTLFANKISAFLKREFRKGGEQEEAFKGRDVFDLAWFLEQSQKQGWSLKPNFARLKDLLEIESNQDLRQQIIKKLKKIERKALVEDLRPFFSEVNFVYQFAENFEKIISQNISRALGKETLP